VLWLHNCIHTPLTHKHTHMQEWHIIEHTYLEGCALGFANIAEQHGLAVAHFDNIKQQFNALLAKPDKRIQIVTDFQQVGARKVQG